MNSSNKQTILKLKDKLRRYRGLKPNWKLKNNKQEIREKKCKLWKTFPNNSI
jgi:hypothetical protein